MIRRKRHRLVLELDTDLPQDLKLLALQRRMTVRNLILETLGQRFPEVQTRVQQEMSFIRPEAQKVKTPN